MRHEKTVWKLKKLCLNLGSADSIVDCCQVATFIISRSRLVYFIMFLTFNAKVVSVAVANTEWDIRMVKSSIFKVNNNK